jgi:hypothetical protein
MPRAVFGRPFFNPKDVPFETTRRRVSKGVVYVRSVTRMMSYFTSTKRCGNFDST